MTEFLLETEPYRPRTELICTQEFPEPVLFRGLQLYGRARLLELTVGNELMFAETAGLSCGPYVMLPGKLVRARLWLHTDLPTPGRVVLGRWKVETIDEETSPDRIWTSVHRLP